MKKQILLFSSILLSTIAFSQDNISAGIRAGIVSSSIRGDANNSLRDMLEFTDGMVTTKNNTGFYAGANTHIELGKGFSIEPGIYYSQKGYEMKGEIDLKGIEFLGANAKAQLTSHYVDVPVLLKANIGGLEIFGGPQVAYLAKADLKATAGALGFNFFSRKLDATEEMNRWDAGITGGLGYQFENGLNLRASYEHGLSKLDKNQNMEAYNQAFKVGIGFKF
ncbi:MAG TPA: porin family protein [Chitinophagaceae bacterium]